VVEQVEVPALSDDVLDRFTASVEGLQALELAAALAAVRPAPAHVAAQRAPAGRRPTTSGATDSPTGGHRP
jgi:hypothetical protein